jgi:hypothetical protein
VPLCHQKLRQLILYLKSAILYPNAYFISYTLVCSLSYSRPPSDPRNHTIDSAPYGGNSSTHSSTTNEILLDLKLPPSCYHYYYYYEYYYYYYLFRTGAPPGVWNMWCPWPSQFKALQNCFVPASISISTLRLHPLAFLGIERL